MGTEAKRGGLGYKIGKEKRAAGLGSWNGDETRADCGGSCPECPEYHEGAVHGAECAECADTDGHESTAGVQRRVLDHLDFCT